MDIKEKEIKMNLQLFSDELFPGDNPLTSEPPAIEPTEPANEPSEPVNEPAEPVHTSSEPEFDVKEYMDNMMGQIMEKLPQQEPQEQQPIEEQPKELTPEEIEKINEDFMNKFYENPTQTLQELAQNIAAEQVKPIQQHYENQQKAIAMESQIKQFASQVPDFQEYAGDMAQIIDNNPYLNDAPNALEVAYKMAKGERAAQPQSFEQMLADPNNIQKIIQNEEIKKMFLSNHMSEIKQGQPPIGVGSSSGGQTNITPPNEPKSIQDSTKAWLSTLG